MREWDLPRQSEELARAKEAHDKPENRIIRNGKAICRACGQAWDRLVHGC